MKKHTEFIKSITKKSLLPSYLLHGVETYFTTQILAKILDIAIPKHEKDFNEYILQYIIGILVVNDHAAHMPINALLIAFDELGISPLFGSFYFKSCQQTFIL